MRERIRKAQGEMWVDSVPGKSTSLRFHHPLRANANIDEALWFCSANPGSVFDPGPLRIFFGTEGPANQGLSALICL